MSRASATLSLLKHRRPFLDGLSAPFDYTPISDGYHISDTPDLADARALAADFEATGDDMRTAITDYGRSSR